MSVHACFQVAGFWDSRKPTLPCRAATIMSRAKISLSSAQPVELLFPRCAFPSGSALIARTRTYSAWTSASAATTENFAPTSYDFTQKAFAWWTMIKCSIFFPRSVCPAGRIRIRSKGRGAILKNRSPHWSPSPQRETRRKNSLIWTKF